MFTLFQIQIFQLEIQQSDWREGNLESNLEIKPVPEKEVQRK